jgi:regulator of cell morphogenesis and NO signaling
MNMVRENETVREIALRQPASIRVFEQFGIDYCCGGRKPLATACDERKIELARVLTALDAAAKGTPAPDENWSDASLRALCEHIVSTHHAYVKRELPRLQELSQKVVARHGGNHAELPAMQFAVLQLAQELTQHLAKEEAILFPYVVQMERFQAGNASAPHGCFGSVAQPIAMMNQEHDAAGELMARLRRLSNDYTLPADACPTYHAFFDGLRDFEHDLHQHIHLENNILFPRAIAMESAIAN